jgi:hypothetical protein
MQVNRIDYKKYNLRKNPFPYVGIPNSEHSSIFVDRINESEAISECLLASSHGASAHLVLVSTYGNGKTTTLHQLNHFLTKSQFVFPIYVSNPGDSFKQLYCNIMSSIGLNKLENFIWKYLAIDNKDPNIRNKIENGKILASDVIEKTKKNLPCVSDYSDFMNSFLHIIFEETRLLSWRHLSGEMLSSDQRRVTDLVSNIDSDEKAIRALITFKRILSSIGIRLLCIMIDELEYIESLSLFKKQRMLNQLRHLIDLNPEGLSLIMCCAPESWNSMILGYHAFSERISRQILLPPISDKIAKQLVGSYLSRFRLKDVKNELYPFTDEAVGSICHAANGNIRRILMICNRSLDFASKNNHDLITSNMIKKLV